jgi:hypothetical protein
VKENFVSSLRVNIQAKKEGSEDRYIDNVDLFSARSRTSFASNLAYSFDLEKARVEKDLSGYPRSLGRRERQSL